MRHQRSRATALTILCLGLLGGCETPPKPPGLLVETAPPGAVCIVSRAGQPLATADPTPAIVHFPAVDAAPLTVSCRRHGFADATISVAPTPPPTLGFPNRVDIALAPLPPW